MAELDIWLNIISDQGITGWLKFVEAATHQPVSDINGLQEAIDMYGKWPVVEGVLAAGKKNIKGDPLPYIYSVAMAKWKENYTGDEYTRGIDRTKRRVAQQNEELQEKLERARNDQTKSET